MLSTTRRFTFEAAHYLPDYDGPCATMHGHSYVLEVTVEGNVGRDGMVMDFARLKAIVQEKIIDVVDHKNLNLIWDRPTAEMMITSFRDRMIQCLNGEKVRLKRLRLWETTNCYVEWENEV
jgi:6-pyruvoyltetrahydropterin/6-carboxytetrahydropterin synthase